MNVKRFRKHRGAQSHGIKPARLWRKPGSTSDYNDRNRRSRGGLGALGRFRGRRQAPIAARESQFRKLIGPGADLSV